MVTGHRPRARTLHRSFAGHRLCLRSWAMAEGRRRNAVFLHNGLGAIGSWLGLPAMLAGTDLGGGPEGGSACHAYDRRGYGRSAGRAAFPPGFMEAEVPALVEIVDFIGAVPVDLVGHSDGATIALLAAARHPERIRSVVSIAAHTFVEPLTTTSIRGLLRDAADNGPPGWLRRLHGPRALALLQAWADVWLGQVHGRWDIRPELGRIRCPVLAVQGSDDEFGSEEQLHVIGREVPSATTWLIEGAGHTPFSNQAPFVDRIAAFWSRT